MPRNPRPLLRHTTPQTPWRDLEDAMTVPAAAGKLGICDRTYRERARRGTLPITRLSAGDHRVLKSDLRRLLRGEWAPAGEGAGRRGP